MLTVLCPDAPLEDATDRRWPERLLGRLQRSAVLARHRDDAPIPTLAPLESWLSTRFGLSLSGTVTVAAYQRFAYPQPAPPAGEFTVTPVCLRAGMDHLVLQPGRDLQITAAEASQLIESANAFLAQDGISLAALDPDCWLLKIPDSLRLELRSSMQAGGRNVHAYMPAGEDGRRLRSILNELQMLWHDQPVNTRRQTEGLAAINSIWVEGQIRPDAISAPLQTSFATVFSDQAVTRGLAAGSGLSGTQEIRPVAAAQAENLAACRGDVLLELSGHGNLAVLDNLLQTWPHPVEICFTDERQWLDLKLSPLDRWRFWRRTTVANTPAKP